MATPQGKTADGFETQFGVDHLSHFLLFKLLEPLLLAGTPSRVISVSSAAHRMSTTRPHDFNFTEPESYDPLMAYGQAKTANIHFINALTRHYGDKGLKGLPLNPGGIASGLQVYLSPEQARAWDEDPAMAKYMKSAEQGAATSVYAALGKTWEGKGGLYLSDCAEQGPFKGKDMYSVGDEGYAPWAFDHEAEEKLWNASLEMVGLGPAQK